MPVDHAVHPEFNIVLVVFRGLVTAQENVDAVREYRSGPRYDPMHHVLMDLAECRFPDDFFAQMREMSERLRHHYVARDPRSVTSIYAPGNVAYGMGRLYKTSVNPNAPYRVEVFRTQAEALRFADLDPDVQRVQGLLRPAGPAGRVQAF